MAAEGARTIVYRPSGPRPRRRRSLLLASAAALLTLACQREPVARYRVPKASAVPAAVELGPGTDSAPAAGALRWTLPPGWKETPGGGPMRYATLTAPVSGRLEVTVIRLPGPAGGELANVNRWRNQLGLAPIVEADLPSARKVLATKAGDLNLYDFTSGGEKKSRTVAGLAQVQGESWFLKMTGDADAVAKARAPFLDLLRSLRLEAR